MKHILRVEDYICENCKYFGCERSKNCETICDKWEISELVMEDLLEALACEEAQRK